MSDDIVINFSVNENGSGATIERVNKKLGETEKQSTGLMSGLNKAKTSVTDFLSANKALIAVLTGVGIAVGKVLQDHIEYANAVRQQAQLANTSTEAASRYLQVLDDYKISSQDALAATRALTKEGHAPTIETLAQLSDQYLALNSAEAKNEFVIKNLGRAGLQWVEVLNKGSKALLEQGAGIDKNLILTQRMVDDARRAEVAMDNWNDSIEAIKTQLAVHLLPALTDSADGALWLTKTVLMFVDAVKEGKVSEFDLGEALRQTREEIEGSEQAMLDNADATGTMTEEHEAASDAAKELSQSLEGILSNMFAINDQNEQYAQTLADLAKSDDELIAKKQQLTLQMWEEQRAGKLTNDEYLRYVQQIDDVNKSLEENAQKRTDAADDLTKASEKQIYDLVQQRLAADGIISSGEFEYLQDLAVQKGLVTQADADQAVQASRTADALVSAFAQTQGPMDQALNTMLQIKSMDGTVVNFGVNFSQSGSLNMGMSNLAGGGGLANPAPRDSGGPGIAGTPYLIGTGAQPEVFVPNTNGTFVPNANKLGSTYNITVNNPKKETAENSIRRELKKLSYNGVAS